VATTGADAGDCSVTPCLTIQYAVNQAIAADTINVAAGSYPAAVSVTKQLTLRGAQGGVDARTRSVPIAQETVISNASISTNQSGVVVDGFTIQNTVPAVGIGLAFAGTGGSQILNNIVRHFSRGTQLSAASGQTLVRHNLFANNNIGLPSAAIYTDGPVTNMTVDENTFASNAQGVFINPDKPPGGQNVDITGNEFTGNGNGVLVFETTDVGITGNTFSGSPGSQVYIGGDDHDVRITGNLITNGSANAITLDNSQIPPNLPNSGVVVTGNTITGHSGAARAALRVGPTANSGALEFHFNRVVGNTAGVSNDDSGDTIDAEDNWWGCNGGPGAAGCNGVIGTAAASVDFDPWLVLRITATPASVVTGADSAILAAIDRNSDGATPAPSDFPTVQLAFGAALGTIAPPLATTAAQLANATFTAGGTPGAGEATATLDNQTVTAPITITAPSGGGVAGATGSSFSLIKVKKRKKRGTARLTVVVPGAGTVWQSGKRVKRRSKSFGAAGTYKLRLKSKPKIRRRLHSRGKAKVRVVLTFTPADGSAPQTVSRKIKLIDR